MSHPSGRSTPFSLLLRAAPVVMTVVQGLALAAQDRLELVNRSGSPWSLSLVLGTREGCGTLTVLDKLTGARLRTLEKVPDRVDLGPGGRYILDFQRSGGFFRRNFILRDGFGSYVEYAAYSEFPTDRRLTFDLVGHQVGPLASMADDTLLEQRLRDAIPFSSEAITILPPDLRWPSLFGLSTAPKDLR